MILPLFFNPGPFAASFSRPLFFVARPAEQGILLQDCNKFRPQTTAPAFHVLLVDRVAARVDGNGGRARKTPSRRVMRNFVDGQRNWIRDSASFLVRPGASSPVSMPELLAFLRASTRSRSGPSLPCERTDVHDFPLSLRLVSGPVASTSILVSGLETEEAPRGGTTGQRAIDSRSSLRLPTSSYNLAARTRKLGIAPSGVPIEKCLRLPGQLTVL